MNFEELLKEKVCACGKTHTCAIRHIVIKQGANKELGALLGDYQNVLLVADTNTYAACGEVIKAQIGQRLEGEHVFVREGLVIPKFGVYACVCLIDGVRYPAVTNIGTRPTVSGAGITVEPWILDFSGDLYDRPITLEFYRFLRPETRFPDLAALQQQIRRDAEDTRQFPKEYL